MALNYAQVWEPELLEILMQGTLTSPFVTSNVTWLDAENIPLHTDVCIWIQKPQSKWRMEQRNLCTDRYCIYRRTRQRCVISC